MRVLVFYFLYLLIIFKVHQISAKHADIENFVHRYEIIKPVIFNLAQEKGEWLSDMASRNEVLLTFQAFRKRFDVQLHVNEDLLSRNFAEILQSKERNVTIQPNIEKLASCFYQGKLQGIQHSWAAVNICDGIRGTISDGKEIYRIEPDITSALTEHLIFKASDMKERTFFCGASFEYWPKWDARRLHGYLEKINIFQKADNYSGTIYVKLVIVNDHGEYLKNNKNETAVIQKDLEIINIVNGIYSPLDIKFTVTAAVVWTESNQMEMEDYIVHLFENFAEYRIDKLKGKYPHDIALLFTTQDTIFGILGYAGWNRVCDENGGIVVVRDHDDSVNTLAKTFAHEIGHSLGMDHDDEHCKCPVDYCIMFPSFKDDSIEWSECSKQVVADMHKGSRPCLNSN